MSRMPAARTFGAFAQANSIASVGEVPALSADASVSMKAGQASCCLINNLLLDATLKLIATEPRPRMTATNNTN